MNKLRNRNDRGSTVVEMAMAAAVFLRIDLRNHVSFGRYSIRITH